MKQHGDYLHLTTKPFRRGVSLTQGPKSWKDIPVLERLYPKDIRLTELQRPLSPKAAARKERLQRATSEPVKWNRTIDKGCTHWRVPHQADRYLQGRMSNSPVPRSVQLELAAELVRGWEAKGYAPQVSGEGTATKPISTGFEATAKRYTPGLDGDFHTTTTNAGYSRTPYGGFYTSFK